jgi:CMP-N-acetylneuraminic acid synthetase
MYKNTSNVDLKPLNENHNKGARRQDHGSTYVRNGAIYLTKVSHIVEKQLIISDNPLFIEMNKSDSLNIDTIEDLDLVRKTLCK